MMRVSPKFLIQSRPITANLCLSIYCQSPQSLLDGIEEARATSLKDHSKFEVEKTFSSVDRWIRTTAFREMAYPIALFATAQFSGFTNLPSIPKNLAVVSTSFHIKPLLKWLQRDKPFFVLKFEAPGARLFQGGVTYLNEIIQIPVRPAQSLDSFLGEVHQSVQRVIEDFGFPTVLAGSVEITDRYFKLAKSRKLVRPALLEASDLEPVQKIHQAAFRLLEPHLQKIEDALVKKYWQSHQNGQTSNSLRELIVLGLQGRITHLFVSEKMNLWGQIDFRTGNFTCGQKQLDSLDDCILDDLSEIVIYHGGKVTVLPSERMPNNNAACAILKSRGKRAKFKDETSDCQVRFDVRAC